MNINVVIPMAGAGSRFAKEGFDLPKPFIPVDGRTMIECAVETLGINGTHHFIVREEQRDEFDVDGLLHSLCSNCNIIEVDHLTEGPAQSALLAKPFINNNSPLIIANCDQVLDWSWADFIQTMGDADGAILTYEDDDPKSSYIEVENGVVTRTAEKEVISNDATVGIYIFSRGSDFVKYAEQMMQKNIRAKGEFYVSLVYNEMIQDNKKIVPYDVTDNVWLIGTPRDLQLYQEEMNEAYIV